ncbi:MAG: UDP-2,3-diacylglucosamine diphosphatase [Burkholderiaceae bacterium]
MNAAAEAGGWQEFVAPPEWRSIDFISDLHLAEDTLRTFEAWRDHLLNTRADAVIILGDLFEAWVGDDARHEGFESRAAATLIEASARRSIGFMVGNRDFLLGREMLDACGVLALPDPTVLTAFSARALLTHGDAWCLADVDYQQYRQQVRDPMWRSQVLARPLDERRALALSMRAQSAGKAAEHAGTQFDVDRTTALRWMAAADAPTLVHGHTHRPATESLAGGQSRHVLSDWDFDHGAASGRAEVLRWSANGWVRMTPAEATAAEPRT